MKPKRAVLLFPWLAVLLAAGATAETWRNHFDFDGLSRPPAYFDFEALGAPAKASWTVMADKNPPSPPNTAMQAIIDRPAGSVAVALRRNVTLEDGRVSVYVKRVASTAGLVFRMSGPKDGLLLLVDAVSGHARLAAFRDGNRSELASGNGVVDREWNKIEVTLAGPDVRATWNDAPLLSGKDSRPIGGRAGMATEGPGRAQFDELVIDTGVPPQK
jgi:hypothetical protein